METSRYDTQKHDLTDYTEARKEIFPGQDYSNPRIKDFHKGNTPISNEYNDNNQWIYLSHT